MKKSLLKLSLATLAMSIGISSYAQTYTFTTCGATGKLGPTQGQINATYTGPNTLTGAVTINTQGIQEWTVPVTGNYRIEVWGANAGTPRTGQDGLGRKISGEVMLSSGTVLSVVVGQSGLLTTQSGFQAVGKSGGGGASWVYSVNTPYIVAGGGGGGGEKSNSSDAPFDTNFYSGVSYFYATTVQQNTNVGQGGPVGDSLNNTLATGAGGGGWFSDGEESTFNRQNLFDNRGRGKANGFIGGTASNHNADGGFGGGAAGVDNTGAGGGGGGYTGGPGGEGYGGSADWGSGGGGGMYYSPSFTNITDLGLNSAAGQVIITLLCTPPAVAIAAFNPDTVCVTDPAITLPIATPANGTYSGNGVSGGTFNPATAGTGSHYVTYTFTDSLTCSNSDSTMIVVESCVGIDENDNLLGVTVFPNPVDDIINVNVENIATVFNYTLTSVDGKVIHQAKNISTNTFTIDITKHTSGIYFLKIETDEISNVYRVIKQ
jgi:hypothetical protein